MCVGFLYCSNCKNKESGRRLYKIKGQVRYENGDNKESGRRRYTIKGPQREEKGDNKESGRRGYTIKGPQSEEHDDKNRARAKDEAEAMSGRCTRQSLSR